MSSSNKSKSARAQVRTRFAPSPTGVLHIGSARTALFSWLYARHYGGEFILRIEDTDRERSSEASVNAIIDGLNWLGLDYDGDIVYQTQRLDRYREVAARMLENGDAYYCHCSPEDLQAMRDEQIKKGLTPKYDGRCRSGKYAHKQSKPVIRFKKPDEGHVQFDDAVYGTINIANDELDDLVLVRADGLPTYNFAVVVDDMDMAMTHIIRGEDHLTNTAKQVNIWHAVAKVAGESALPSVAHIPMILAPDGKRLSKRTGATGLDEYKDAGYLPDALLNYLARLGWSYGDEEIFTRDELIKKFSLENIGQSAAALNTSKLQWLNKHYMQEMPAKSLCDMFIPYLKGEGIDTAPSDANIAIVEALRERYDTLKEMAAGAVFFYSAPEYDKDKLKKIVDPKLAAQLVDALNAIEDKDWQPEVIKRALSDLAEKNAQRFADIGKPLRYILTAGAASPGIAETACLIGKDECLSRIKQVS